MEIGKIIKRARLEKGFTQEQLANMVGVQKSAIAKWENGRVSEIKRSNLKKLAAALGLKPTVLLSDANETPVALAEGFANIYLDSDLQKMIVEFNSLDEKKKDQVMEYIHLLSREI